jgi:pilus assembly protein CpaB
LAGEIQPRPDTAAFVTQEVKRMKPARIVVLVIAVAAGGVAALLAGRSEKAPPPEPVQAVDTVEVLVAKADIPMGQVVSANNLQWQTWPTAAAASQSFIRKTERGNAVEQLSGSIARSPFVGGEPIREAKLIKATGSGFMAAILPAGMRAISTEISPETGAGGFILPNDHVDVILTRRDREAERKSGVDTHTSETILTNIRVLAIDQMIQEKDGQRVVVGKTATLELTPRQAETLALSRQLGSLSLALRSLVDASKSAPESADPEEAKRGRGEINMVRFGVSTTATAR